MFGLFKKSNADWTANITPTEKIVAIKAGDNLLNAALEAGLAWPHDCRVGSCGTCKCTLKDGKIKPLADFAYVLDGDQLDAGMILACQTSPRSDLVVEVALDGAAEAQPTTSLQGTINRTSRLTHDIMEVCVATKGAFSASYVAGQYAEVGVGDIAKPRSYSFAHAPENNAPDEFTFYIRLVPGGEFTEWLFEKDRTGAAITVGGPYGSFWLRPGRGSIVCVAGGSGLAPVKALLEDALLNNEDRDVWFLFGARTQEDLYCLDEMKTLETSWKGHGFTFIPVLSEEPAESDWQGARGLVTDYLQDTYIDSGLIDIATSQGYLCGPPPMIDAAIEVLNTAGLSDENIYFDKFLDASSMPDGR